MRNYPYTLAAGRSEAWQIAGKVLLVTEGTGPVHISFDGGPEIRMERGQKRVVPFQGIRLRNAGGATISGELIIGDGDFVDQRQSGAVSIQSPGAMVTVADQAVGAGATASILAANTNRKEAIISNVGSAMIRVGDSDVGAARGVPVAAGATFILSTTGEVFVHNTGAAPQNVAVSYTE